MITFLEDAGAAANNEPSRADRSHRAFIPLAVQT